MTPPPKKKEEHKGANGPKWQGHSGRPKKDSPPPMQKGLWAKMAGSLGLGKPQERQNGGGVGSMFVGLPHDEFRSGIVWALRIGPQSLLNSVPPKYAGF